MLASIFPNFNHGGVGQSVHVSNQRMNISLKWCLLKYQPADNIARWPELIGFDTKSEILKMTQFVET